MDGLKNKVAIVTGGATKIGAAVCRAFQREGTKVVIADINDNSGEPLVFHSGRYRIATCHPDIAD
jgi:NAD(P)-dependent dehydrogenase (short-subunit alcohol dehydrogenase family)